MEKEIIILNKLVKILLTKTECGINVLIAGGDFAHIGANARVKRQHGFVGRMPLGQAVDEVPLRAHHQGAS